jgi:protein-disulfide isomerase
MCYKPPPMTLRPLALMLLVAAAVACSESKKKEEPPPPPVAELGMQETIALESTPGSTPPLTDATEPAPAPMAGLDGAPGPSPAYGPANAPVYVFVLTDFQCPVCRRAVEPLKYLARRHPNDVRLVIKQNALVSHSRAAAAAAASIAAFRQGKYWAYADRLFESGSGFDDDGLVTHAQALGLDAERFKKDMADPAAAAQVKYENALANKFDMASTPGFIVNGTKQMGWGSYMGIKSTVDKELARAKTIAAGGVAADRVAYEATKQSGPNGPEMADALFPKAK